MKLFVVLHHSADPSPKPQFDKIDMEHFARGFPKSSLGFYVGYHYFVGVDGTVKQARQEWEVGAHCAAKMMNYLGIGICLAGDFTQQQPTERQLEALAGLVSDVQHRNGIPDEAVLLHKECKPTACPGTDLRALVRALRPPSAPTGIKAAVARRLALRLLRGL
jgi:N-acetylmuramoyl-L-alanine amidase